MKEETPARGGGPDELAKAVTDESTPLVRQPDESSPFMSDTDWLISWLDSGHEHWWLRLDSSDGSAKGGWRRW